MKNVFMVQFDNDMDWSDHSHHVVGIFSTRRGAEKGAQTATQEQWAFWHEEDASEIAPEMTWQERPINHWQNGQMVQTGIMWMAEAPNPRPCGRAGHFEITEVPVQR